MHMSRRSFVTAASSVAALGGLAVAFPRTARAQETPEKAERPLRLLVLGGTSFLGPAIVEAAQARGHAVTLFNRGRTRPDLFPSVEKLRGDRDPDKDEGLSALVGDRRWDTAIDTSGFYPRIVGASAALLADRVQQYIFVSSISAYASTDAPDVDETAPVATMPDPTLESMGPNFEYYGALKALCEQAAEAAMPGRVANIRPGFIVGPEDWSGRFTFWPLRIREGGRMPCPGRPDDPVQFIDVADLGAWLVACAERSITGIYNATGPAEPTTMGALLETCRTVAGTDTSFTWIDEAFLSTFAERSGTPMAWPIWVSPREAPGFHRTSIRKALAAGLTTRSTEAVVRGLLAWYDGVDDETRRRVRRGGPTREQEHALLAAWDAHGGGGAGG